MRTINRNADWGRMARGYALAAIVLGCIWAMLLGNLV